MSISLNLRDQFHINSKFDINQTVKYQENVYAYGIIIIENTATINATIAARPVIRHCVGTVCHTDRTYKPLVNQSYTVCMQI
jgi:hypothetical protein